MDLWDWPAVASYDFIASRKRLAVVVHVPTRNLRLLVVSADVADGNELLACVMVPDRNEVRRVVQLLAEHLHHFVGGRFRLGLAPTLGGS